MTVPPQYDKITSMTFKIFSGGQTGVDRAAIDWAIENNFEYGGYVPKGGRALDGIDLCKAYPNLIELKSADYPARTLKNIKSANATLIVCPDDVFKTSRGTKLTVKYAMKEEKPFLHLTDGDSSKVLSWLTSLVADNDDFVLNVAGPRGDNWPEGYETTKEVLTQVFSEIQS